MTRRISKHKSASRRPGSGETHYFPSGRVLSSEDSSWENSRTRRRLYHLVLLCKRTCVAFDEYSCSVEIPFSSMAVKAVPPWIVLLLSLARFSGLILLVSLFSSSSLTTSSDPSSPLIDDGVKGLEWTYRSNSSTASASLGEYRFEILKLARVNRIKLGLTPCLLDLRGPRRMQKRNPRPHLAHLSVPRIGLTCSVQRRVERTKERVM